MYFSFVPLYHDVAQDGVTALSAAAGDGHTDVVRVLIQAGANMELPAQVCLCLACVYMLACLLCIDVTAYALVYVDNIICSFGGCTMIRGRY